jgi:hypothetical protein
MYSDLRASGQWTKKIFFCVFHSFRWSSTCLCYIPFENAKKSNRLTLLYSIHDDKSTINQCFGFFSIQRQCCWAIFRDNDFYLVNKLSYIRATSLCGTGFGSSYVTSYALHIKEQCNEITPLPVFFT